MRLNIDIYNQIAEQKGWGCVVLPNKSQVDNAYCTFMPTLCKMINKKRIEAEAKRRSERMTGRMAKRI